MANLHHRHADTGKREQIFLGFFQNRHLHDRRAVAEVEDSFSHDVFCAFVSCCASSNELSGLYPPATAGGTDLPPAYCLLPTVFRSTAPAARKISARGTRRSVSIMKKF